MDGGAEFAGDFGGREILEGGGECERGIGGRAPGVVAEVGLDAGNLESANVPIRCRAASCGLREVGKLVEGGPDGERTTLEKCGAELEILVVDWRSIAQTIWRLRSSNR